MIDYIDLLKYNTPVVVAFIAYYLTIKGKRKDIDFQKTKELNIILSNILISWEHLNKISELLHFMDDKSDDLLFPKELLPFMALKNGLLTNNNFEELETSIKMLKQYAPLEYFELVGMTKRFDFINSNYIVPFITFNTTENSKLTIINRTFLDESLNEIEDKMTTTAKLISRATQNKIEKQITKNVNTHFTTAKNELNQSFYEMMISIYADERKNMTYEDFKLEMTSPEAKRQINIELQMFKKIGLEKLVEKLAKNPDLTFEEMEQELNN